MTTGFWSRGQKAKVHVRGTVVVDEIKLKLILN
jgi:hypothetical protein